MTTQQAELSQKQQYSGGALLLFVISLLVVFSGYSAYRASVFGLLIHPYLIPIGCIFPVLIGWRLKEFPTQPLLAMAVFAFFYSFSTLSAGGAVGEVIKLLAALTTIVTVALLVQRPGDLVAGTIGLAIAMGILAVRGLHSEIGEGTIEAFDEANKNTYSLYALPVLLLSGFICLRMPATSTLIKISLAVAALFPLSAIFMSANRSGYLGAVVVGVMLFWNRKFAGLFLVACISLALAFGLARYGNFDALERRITQTREGNGSDQLRIDILKACFALGLENPLVGVSPQHLPIEIGRRLPLKYRYGSVGSHNIFAHVWAGSGLVCFSALIYLGVCLFRWRRPAGLPDTPDNFFIPARQLMRMILVLWAVRGAFTNEILYNPSFCITLGLGIGLVRQSLGATQWSEKHMARRLAAPLPAPAPFSYTHS